MAASSVAALVLRDAPNRALLRMRAEQGAARATQTKNPAARPGFVFASGTIRFAIARYGAAAVAALLARDGFRLRSTHPTRRLRPSLAQNLFRRREQAVARVRGAVFAELLAADLHLVEVDDGGVVFGVVIAVEPHHDQRDRVLAAVDELLALDGGDVDDLGGRRAGGHRQGGRENRAPHSFRHVRVHFRGTFGPACPAGDATLR